MGTCCCLLLIFIIQFTSARIVPNGIQGRMMPFGMNAREMPNGMSTNIGMPNGLPFNNQFMNQMPAIGNSLPYANIANRNMANVNNIANANLANSNAVENANIAQGSLINANTNQVLATNNQVTAAIVSENLASGNVMPNTSPPAILLNTAEPINPAVNVANAMTKGLKPRSLQLSIGNPFTIKNGIHGKIGNQNFGLQIMADKLDIAGTVSVTGSMPIYGTVTVNGNVPSDGKASVNYGCGSPKRTQS